MPSLVDLGAVVSEQTIMGLSSFHRGVSLIAGQLASLPLRSYTGPPAQLRPVTSVFDNPDPEGQTVFGWKETLFLNLVIYGRAGAIIQRNPSNSIVGLPLAHPLTWSVRLPSPGGKRPKGGLWFDVKLDDGTSKTFDADGFWYVPGLSLDGKNGVSLLERARLSFQTTLAGDRATARMFSHGAMIGGFATPADPDEDLEDDLEQVKRDLNQNFEGWQNAGRIPVLNQRIKLNPWTMTSRDAEFLASRQFQIEEIARWLGVPPHLLMQTEKQTSWGTGVDEQNRGMGKTVLGTWSQRVEEAGSRLLASPRWIRFDFSKLERTAPDREHQMARDDYAGGLITLNEARARLDLGPLEGGDTLKAEPAPDPAPDDDPKGGDDAQ